MACFGILLVLSAAPGGWAFLPPSLAFSLSSSHAVYRGCRKTSIANSAVSSSGSCHHDWSRACGIRASTSLPVGAADDKDAEGLEAELVLVRGMRASQIKKTLTDMRVGHFGVFEVCSCGVLLVDQSVYSQRRESGPTFMKHSLPHSM